jgi:hypothetical protein
MRQILKFLSHPAWQGFGAISTAVGCFLMCVAIYLTISPPVPQPPPPAVTNPPPARVSSSVNNPQDNVNKIINDSLRSIGPGYRGVHRYFNDAPSVGVLAAVFLVLGIVALVSNRRARATT